MSTNYHQTLKMKRLTKRMHLMMRITNCTGDVKGLGPSAATQDRDVLDSSADEKEGKCWRKRKTLENDCGEDLMDLSENAQLVLLMMVILLPNILPFAMFYPVTIVNLMVKI